MDATAFSDETLMAYADGQLDAPTARAVAEAARADPEIARRIAAFGASRALLGEVARARRAPVSADLEARVRATLDAARDGRHAGNGPGRGRVVPFGRARAARTWWPSAAAASVALAAGLAAGMWMAGPDGAGAPADLSVASFIGPGIAEVLETRPSGTRTVLDGAEVATIASFVAADGAFCREFEVDRDDRETVVSVACRAGDGWRPRFAVVAGGTPTDGFAPASSLETLDAYLSAIGAGAPLSLEEEAEALSAGN